MEEAGRSPRAAGLGPTVVFCVTTPQPPVEPLLLPPN